MAHGIIGSKTTDKLDAYQKNSTIRRIYSYGIRSNSFGGSSVFGRNFDSNKHFLRK